MRKIVDRQNSALRLSNRVVQLFVILIVFLLLGPVASYSDQPVDAGALASSQYLRGTAKNTRAFAETELAQAKQWRDLAASARTSAAHDDNADHKASWQKDADYDDVQAA